MDSISKLISEEPSTLVEPKHLHIPVVHEADCSVYTVSVTNPQKTSEKNGHITYTVKTIKTAEGTETVLFRRFNDFVWLFEFLKVTYPSCVVPQIPEKTIIGKFAPELLSFRTRELARFLSRVVSHPVLRNDEVVRIFLTASEEEFATRKGSKEGGQKEGFMAMMKHRASDLGFAVGVSKEEDPVPWFAEQAEEVVNREAILTVMLQNTLRLVSQYKQIASYYASQVERLREFSEGVDDAGIKARCSHNADAMERSKELFEDMACQVEITLRGNILDYVRELQTITEVIERRVPLVRTFTVASKDAASKPNSDTTGKRDEALEALDRFSQAARADIQRVYDLRRGDMERFFTAVAKANEECFTLLAQAWAAAANKK